jgi:Hr1 repeat
MTATMPSDDDPASNDKHLQSLEKQLTIEMKVKNGTENMIQSISQNYQSRDKKLLAEAYTMLDDSKAKIEFLKLKILKVKQNRQTGRVSRCCRCQFVNFLMNEKTFFIRHRRRQRPRMASLDRTSNWSHRSRSASKSCVIDCASKRPSSMAPRM